MKSETPEQLEYAAEVIVWALERCEQLAREKWAKALEAEGITTSGNFSHSIPPAYLEGLAESLRMRAEDEREALTKGGE